MCAATSKGVAEIKAVLDRYDAINAKLGDEMSPEEMDKILVSNRNCRIGSTPQCVGP